LRHDRVSIERNPDPGDGCRGAGLAIEEENQCPKINAAAAGPAFQPQLELGGEIQPRSPRDDYDLGPLRLFHRHIVEVGQA
jgi:hypothetical protein